MDHYWLLPYQYVISAVLALIKLEQETLHNYERPVAYIAWQNAEINRDRKKQRKPFKIDDFYYYMNKEDSNLPEPRYGAAALALIEKGLFPGWGLFVFNDLKVRAGDALPPEILCVQCEDVIILAPDVNDNILNGMMIASAKASENMRTLTSPCGVSIDVMMPKISSSFEAKEDADIRILRIHK